LVRAERLHEASGRLEAKDEAIRRTAESISDERRDERVTLAGELHDSVLPPLFKVHLMGQVIKEDLDAGRLLELDADLPELLSATDEAQRAVREVVSELRSSPIGPGGLAGTVRQLARHLEANGAPPLVLSLGDFPAAPSTNLVLYQAAREAMLNASLYAKSGVIRVHLWSEDGEARLMVVDEGVGFDTARVDERNHFGLQFMRERVEALGGRFVIDSKLGKGTVVAVSVPLEESVR
jgi:signal transduction histidine kinase